MLTRLGLGLVRAEDPDHQSVALHLRAQHHDQLFITHLVLLSEVIPQHSAQVTAGSLRFPPFDRGDHAYESERSVENPDALAATGGRGIDAAGGSIHADVPPG